MSKLLSLFLDRLAERFAAMLAGTISSRVEGLHAAAQAEQQSQLEDLARGYEADGKPEIAATLRQRASRLTSTDLSAEAVEVVQRLTENTAQQAAPTQSPPQADLHSLPDFTSSPPTSGKRRRRMIASVHVVFSRKSAVFLTPIN